MFNTRLIAKYCGVLIDEKALVDAARTDRSSPQSITAALAEAVNALAATEKDLAQVGAFISDSLSDVQRNLTAGPGDRVPSINSVGVLQAHGPRFDALISQRAAQITHLRTITRLWLAQNPGSTDPADSRQTQP